MQKIFIAYGSGVYVKSLHRIGKEAKKLGIFTKIILYTEKDMPLFIQASPLKAYGRGNGYWAWKPYVIWRTMHEYPNSIVVYADCGCTLQHNMEEWNRWFTLLETYDTLAFQYRRNYVYPWQKKDKTILTTNARWTKTTMIRYFDRMIGNRTWLNEEQVWAGLVLACRNSRLIKMWMDISLLNPELIVDCYGNEVVEKDDCFIEHRHDQSLLSALCEYWKTDGHTVKILEETAESDFNAAVTATRIHERPKDPFKTRTIHMIKRIVSEDVYNKLHFWK